MLYAKPLIGYTIDIAKRLQERHSNTDIALSTDSDEIIKVAEECGLHSDYKRPEALGGDTVGKIDAINDISFIQRRPKASSMTMY